MSAGIATYNRSSIPQSIGQKKISHIPMNETINKYSSMREGTGYAWSEANVFPYNETGKVYADISKTDGNAFNVVRGDYIPQNVVYGRTLYNPPHRGMP